MYKKMDRTVENYVFKINIILVTTTTNFMKLESFQKNIKEQIWKKWLEKMVVEYYFDAESDKRPDYDEIDILLENLLKFLQGLTV